jgi:hypothetical protein
MSLSELIERERRRAARLLAIAGVSALVGGVALFLALGALLLGGSRWLLFPRPLPYALWIGVAMLVVLGVRQARKHARREGSLRGVAREVEQERTLRDGALRGTLEVADQGALGRLRAHQLVVQLAEANSEPLAPSLRRRLRRRALIGGALAFVGLIVLFAGVTGAADGWAALVHPARAWQGTLLDGVRLDRVPKAVLRGERLTFGVRAPGRRVVRVAQRTTGASWRETSFIVRSGQAKVTLDAVDADVTVYATDGRAVSDTAVVRVVERPFIGDVIVKALFPAYLDRREETIALGEPARVPQGTVLALEGQSSTELRDVRLTRDKEVVSLSPSGRHFTGRLAVRTNGRYAWSAIGSGGPIADVPPPLDLEVIPDSAPRVEILAPGGDTTVNAGDTVSVSVLATDDHGIGDIDLRSWIVTAKGDVRPWSGRSVSAQKQTQWAGETALLTDPLRPGDALHVVVSAFDISPWHYKGESRELVMRLPTLAEQREAIRAAADSTVARATATATAQRQLQQRTNDASKRRDRQTDNAGNTKSDQNPMSYEAAEQAKEFAQQQRQLADRMKQLQQAAKQLEQQLKQAGTLDSALQSRLREAQKLLSEALTPELAEQLKKLEQASQKLSGEEAQKALADLAQQQQRLREQLEKSVEMLKRAALEGSMATLKDDAQELARKERQLADSLGPADQQKERTDAQRDAKELADKARELSDEVKRLQQRLQQEKAESGAQRTAEADRKVQESAEALDRAAQQSGARQNTQRQGPPQQGAQPQGAQQQGAQQGAKAQGAQQSGQQQGGQQQGAQQNSSTSGNQQSGKAAQGGDKADSKAAESAARQAAQSMEDAANQLAKAREQQVGEWKQELTTELDRSIQEMIQLAREQDGLEQKARQGAPTEDLRAQQSTLQQGVEKSAERLQDAGQKSSLLSQRSLRMVADARRHVEDATRQTQTAMNANQIAGAMRDASESLNQAAASLVRDREKAQNASSASGFAEMLQQLQQMAQQQSALNSAVQELLPRPGASLDARGQQASRQLARQQREVAAKLDDVSDKDDSGRSEELAKEARQIAQALESAQLDQSVLERQQRLFRKMLDAGRLLEDDQREDTGKREAKAWTGTEVFTPQSSSASGRAASKFQPPTWNDLRGLTPEERRLVLEYFKKINGERP